MSDPHPIAARVRPLLSAFAKEDLEILVELVVLVAYADGEIDGPELEALREAFETILGSPLSALAVKTLIGSAVDDIKAAGVSAFASQLGRDRRREPRRRDLRGGTAGAHGGGRRRHRRRAATHRGRDAALRPGQT
jgi:hypothetical protein